MKKSILKNIAGSMKMAWSISRFGIIAPIVIAVLGAVQYFVPVYISAFVLDALTDGTAMAVIMKNVILGLSVTAAAGVAVSYLGERNQFHIHTSVHKFTKRVSDKFISMDYSQEDSPRVSEIRKKIDNDKKWGNGFIGVFNRYNGLCNRFVQIVTALLVLFPLLGENALSRGYILLFIMGIILLTVVPPVYYGKVTTKNYFRLIEEVNTRKSPYALLAYGKLLTYKDGKDIRIYHGEKLINDSIEKEERGFLRDWDKRISISEGKGGVVTALGNAGVMILAYVFVLMQATHGAVSVGNVVKYASMLVLLSDNMVGFFDCITAFLNAAKQQSERDEFMNIPEKMHAGTVVPDRSVHAEFQFENVWFRYPGCEDYTIKNMSFTIKPGERLAIVGMNGSGKTTFIKLLCRLYDPDRGMIRLNGRDIREYDYEEYMKLLSVVFQDFKLFSFGLGDNVAAGYDYDEARIRHCLAQSGFDTRLETLADGLDTCLYKDFVDNGVEISGGEAQKLAIARAIYKDAPVIVLDEPTAALDPIAEYEIYSKFDELAQGKTTLYISHRLSSCRFCDRIAVFDGGEIIECGTHEGLLDKNGRYAELWNAQAQYYH